MKLLHLFPLFVIMLILFSSCKKDAIKYEISDSTIKELSLINSTPDSLMSAELKEKKLNLEKIMTNYIKVEKNKIITTATPRTFKDLNLSENYYNLLLKSIDDLNNYVKENNIENLDEIIRNAKFE